MLYYIIFGLLLGSTFNFWPNIEASYINHLIAFSGLVGLSFLPRSYLGFYLFGLSYHIVSLYWLGHALFFAKYTMGVNLDLVAPLTSFFMGSILALQYPLALRLGGVYWVIPFFLIEWIRSQHGILFPCNLIGYAATTWLSSFRFLGIAGMTGFFVAFTQMRHFPCLAQIGLISTAIFMTVDHYFYQRKPVEYTDYTVKIVQSNVSQKKKLSCTQVKRLIELSALGAKTSFIVWPEAVSVKCLYSHDDLRKDMAKIVPQGSYLILGHMRQCGYKSYGCLSALNSEGKLVATYDKQILMPFGEYMPFGLAKLSHGKDSDCVGELKKILNLTPKAAPMICYELVFGQMLKNYPDAEWIVGVANDSWFCDSCQPFIHLQAAKCRAIESGKPFVLSTNSGISALVGPQGQVLAHIPLKKEGCIDVRLPKPA